MNTPEDRLSFRLGHCGVVRCMTAFPHEQTFARTHRTAVSCHVRTHALQQSILTRSPRRRGRSCSTASRRTGSRWRFHSCPSVPIRMQAAAMQGRDRSIHARSFVPPMRRWRLSACECASSPFIIVWMRFEISVERCHFIVLYIRFRAREPLGDTLDATIIRIVGCMHQRRIIGDTLQ